MVIYKRKRDIEKTSNKNQNSKNNKNKIEKVILNREKDVKINKQDFMYILAYATMKLAYATVRSTYATLEVPYATVVYIEFPTFK